MDNNKTTQKIIKKKTSAGESIDSNNLLALIGLFVMLLLLFMSTASASADVVPSEPVEVDAVASATGDYAVTTTYISTSDSHATAKASAMAVASDGDVATVKASAWAYFTDKASAVADAMASVMSNARETVYAYVSVEVSVSADGSASSKAVSRIWTGDGGNGGDNGNGDNGDNGNGDNGDNGNGDNGDNGNGGDNGNKIKPAIKPPRTKDNDGFFGFAFGKSDPGRYYYFKQVLYGNYTGMRLADDGNNITYSRARAKYYMWMIPNDRGLNQTQFEAKYRPENYTVEVENIMKEEGITS